MVLGPRYKRIIIPAQRGLDVGWCDAAAIDAIDRNLPRAPLIVAVEAEIEACPGEGETELRPDRGRVRILASRIAPPPPTSLTTPSGFVETVKTSLLLGS